MSSVFWVNMDASIESIRSIGRSHLGVELHPAGLEHLLPSNPEGVVPFPRFEKHQGYLFGIIYLPSNNANLSADFDQLCFAVTHDHVLVSVSPHSSSVIDWETLRNELSNIDSTDTTPDGGQFIMKALRQTVRELTTDAQNLERFLHSEIFSIFGTPDLMAIVGKMKDDEHIRPKVRRQRLKDMRIFSSTAAEIA